MRGKRNVVGGFGSVALAVLPGGFVVALLAEPTPVGVAGEGLVEGVQANNSVAKKTPRRNRMRAAYPRAAVMTGAVALLELQRSKGVNGLESRLNNYCATELGHYCAGFRATAKASHGNACILVRFFRCTIFCVAKLP